MISNFLCVYDELNDDDDDGVSRDGQLKRDKLKPSFLEEQQAEYSRRIVR